MGQAREDIGKMHVATDDAGLAVDTGLDTEECGDSSSSNRSSISKEPGK